MPYTRGTKRKRRATFQRRTRSRRSLATYRPRAIRQVASGVHHFKRTAKLSDISLNASGATTQGWYFRLADLPNYTEFTALFDLYRFNKIVVRFVPSFTGSDMNPATTSWAIPTFYSAIDHDDAVTPANLDVLMQYPSLRLTRGNRIHTRIFTPAVSTDIFTGTTEGSSPKFKAWLNCADATVPHYGLKFYIDQPPSTYGKYQCFVTVYMSMKGVR